MQHRSQSALIILLLMISCIKKPVARKNEAKVKPSVTHEPSRDSNEQDIALHIIGGEEVSSGGWDFMASIQMQQVSGGSYHMCGGTFVAPRVILTAAHCLTDSGASLVRPEQLSIKAGVRDLIVDTGSVTLDVASVMVHESFMDTLKNISHSTLIQTAASATGMDTSYFAPLYGNDIGLIFLKSSPWPDRPVKEWTIHTDQKNSGLISDSVHSFMKKSGHRLINRVAGWGITERRPIEDLLQDASQFDHQKTSDRLKSGQQPVISSSECREHLFNWFRQQLGFGFFIFESELNQILDQTMSHIVCAGDMQVGSVSFCSGDSGGPLIYEKPESASRQKGSMIPDKRPTRIQTGLVSFSLGCNSEGIPDLYTRVGDYSNWILSKIQEQSP